MTVNKQERFQQVASFPNVFEYTDFQSKEAVKPKGRWHNDMFGNDHPITLELGCGTGAYTMALSERYPNRNFVGIDIKGHRIWKGAKKALAQDRANVRFLRMYIDHLDEYFAADEVAEIWITFPDPYSRAGDRNKRLTAPKFLRQYASVLQPGGTVHFKTDDHDFFTYSRRSVQRFGGSEMRVLEGVHDTVEEDSPLAIKTAFERQHIADGRRIHYLQFHL